MNSLIDRLIRIKDGLTDRVSRDARAHADKMRQWSTKQLHGSTKLAEEG